MTTLVTNKFREHVSDQLLESFTEASNNIYYLTALKHTPFNDDSTPPTPNDSESETNLNFYQQAIFGKKITSSDVSLMIPKYMWTANTVYTRYDNQSNTLFNDKFYVAVDAGSFYYIYKCLDNNNNSPSTDQPSDISESACSFVTTSDQYRWKLMYKVSEATFEKFSTQDFMPVLNSANVYGNNVSGAIDVVKISNNGSGYVATLTGEFAADDLRISIPNVSGNSTTYRLESSASSNNDFYNSSAIYLTSGTGAGQIKKIISYSAVSRVIVIESEFTIPPSSGTNYLIGPYVNISGDGSNATAYAIVSSNATVNNFVSKINIVNRGSNYTYASAYLEGNTGGISNNASLTVIIPPTNGHGASSTKELGARAIGISASFSTSESGFISTENDYRQVALLVDPLFKEAVFTVDTEVGTFSTNELVYQFDYKPLTGSISGNTTSTTLTGTGTSLSNCFKQGDKILITDTSSNVSCLREVSTVSNSTILTVNSALSFDTSFATISFVDILAQGKRTGGISPYVILSNVEPKFVSNKLIIGANSGAVANVVNITINTKNYNNWSIFDNRTALAYSSLNGSISEDSLVYQDQLSISNAYFHSSNNTFVFLTEEKGPIFAIPGSQLRDSNTSSYFILSTTKYDPELVKGSGKVLYIENNTPISRSPSQSENVKIIIKF